MNRPAISIIVPCRNEAGHIAASLSSILTQEAIPDGRSLEILIADGMSDDGTRAKLAEIASVDPRVVVIDNPGRIVSTGLNAAIIAARGEIIIRMDAHTEYAPDYVRQCVSALEATGADNVGGPWQAAGTGRLQRAIAAAFRSPFSNGGSKASDPHFEGPLSTVYLGCWRKETLMRIGRFDEELVRNQDDELNFRLELAGGRIWQTPLIQSRYRPRSSIRALFRQYMQYGYWKVRVIQKHRRPASLRHLVPVIFAAGLCFGWMAGFAHPILWLAYACVLATYAALSAFHAILTACKEGWDLLPLLPAIFLTYHLAYGIGFGRGLLDFVILRRAGVPYMSALTRN